MTMKILNSAGVLLYDKQGRVFLTKNKYWKEYLLPGGKEELGETPEQTVRREAREELGVDISDLLFVRTDHVVPGSDLTPCNGHELATYDYFLFTSFVGRPDGDVRPSQEFRTHGWYTVPEARALNLTPPIRRVIEFFEYIILPELNAKHSTPRV